MLTNTAQVQTSLLRARRQSLGLSLRGVASSVGIDPAHLSRIERGLALPSVPVLICLAAKLNLPPAEVLATFMAPLDNMTDEANR